MTRNASDDESAARGFHLAHILGWLVSYSLVEEPVDTPRKELVKRSHCPTDGGVRSRALVIPVWKERTVPTGVANGYVRK